MISLEGNAATCNKDEEGQNFYACRKCGTLLFAEENVIHGEPSMKERHGTENSPSLSLKNVSSSSEGVAVSERSSERFQNSLQCSSLFLSEAPSWLQDTSEHHSKITCPKCKSRVGSFSWSGLTCSCGRWITPGFQFQLSRVETRGLYLGPSPALMCVSSAAALPSRSS